MATTRHPVMPCLCLYDATEKQTPRAATPPAAVASEHDLSVREVDAFSSERPLRQTESRADALESPFLRPRDGNVPARHLASEKLNVIPSVWGAARVETATRAKVAEETDLTFEIDASSTANTSCDGDEQCVRSCGVDNAESVVDRLRAELVLEAHQRRRLEQQLSAQTEEHQRRCAALEEKIEALQRAAATTLTRMEADVLRKSLIALQRDADAANASEVQRTREVVSLKVQIADYQAVLDRLGLSPPFDDVLREATIRLPLLRRPIGGHMETSPSRDGSPTSSTAAQGAAAPRAIARAVGSPLSSGHFKAATSPLARPKARSTSAPRFPRSSLPRE